MWALLRCRRRARWAHLSQLLRGGGVESWRRYRCHIRRGILRARCRRFLGETQGMAGQVSPLAGKKPDAAMLVDVPRLVTAYFTGKPDPSVPSQRVAFGTSGHRGSAFDNAFNEDHILAISQAICRHRVQNGVDGPLYIGIDTHALSEPALASALEVFAANDVNAMIDAGDGYTPTPVVSHAILTYNKGRKSGLADGIVITPSHNPPEDGG